MGGRASTSAKGCVSRSTGPHAPALPALYTLHTPGMKVVTPNIAFFDVYLNGCLSGIFHVSSSME